jgi:endo-1,3-1,4-beta-glycanase ExoK
VAELPKRYSHTTVLQVFLAAVFWASLLILWAGTPEAEGAESQGVSFRDDFGSFEEAGWIKSQHTLGRSRFDPDNVSVSDGKLRLKIPAETVDGAEIESKEAYGYGTFVARMRTPVAPSSITAFFLYRSPDFEAELDIEIYNNGNVDYVTYAGGERTHVASEKLPFDPRKRFHTYRLDYYPRVVRFYVDGALVQRYTTGLPEGPMKLLVNTWFPEWLPGIAPPTDRRAVVDWIRYVRP